MKRILALFLVLAGCQAELPLERYSEFEVHTTQGGDYGVIQTLSNLSMSRKENEPMEGIHRGQRLFNTSASQLSITIYADKRGLDACQVELFKDETFRQYLRKIISAATVWAERTTAANHRMNIEIILTQRRSYEYRSTSAYLNTPTLSLAFSLGSSCTLSSIKARIIDAFAQTMHEIVHANYFLNAKNMDALGEEKAAYRVQYCSALSMDNNVHIPISPYISSAASVQELTEKILHDTNGSESVTQGILANAIILFELSSKAGSGPLTGAALSGPLGEYCSTSL